MTMVYDLPTADLQAGSAGQFQAPEAKNYAPAQAQEMGGALVKTGSAIGQVVQDIQDTVDTAATKEADNALAEFSRTTMYDPENGYMQTSGKNALEARGEVVKSLQEKVKGVEDSLTNDVQKYMFRKAATQRMQSAMLQIDGHAMQQAKVYNLASAKTRMEGSVQDALKNVAGFDDPKSIYTTEKLRAEQEAKAVANLEGLDEKQFVLAAQSELHTNAIGQLLEDDKTVKLAKAYYDKFKDGEINPKLYDEINKKIDYGVARVDGKAYGNTVFAEKTKELTVNDALPEAQMYKDIEADQSLSAKGKEFAMAQVHTQIARYNAVKKQNEEGASNNIAGLINDDTSKTQYSTVVKTIDGLKGTIDEKARMNLYAEARRVYKIDEKNAEAKMARKLENLGKFLAFQNDYSSGRLGKMTPDQVKKYTANFGEYTDNAMQFVQHANDSATDVKLTTDKLKDELRIMEQNPAFKNTPIPKVDGNDPVDKANMALLQSRVVARIAASGKAGPGKQMSVQQALAEELRPVITKKGWFSDDKTPKYKLGTTGSDNPKTWTNEAKDAYVNDSYFRQFGFYPSQKEATRLRHQLER